MERGGKKVVCVWGGNNTPSPPPKNVFSVKDKIFVLEMKCCVFIMLHSV